MRMASSPTPDFQRPREELARTLRQIYDLDLTTTSGGNLSLRDDDGAIWITPAGIDKGELRPDQVARVEGPNDVDSSPPASSELPFHRAIYATRSDLRAVVHAHPVSLVAFSIAQAVPDTRVSAHAHALCGSVGFAPYALPGSRELGEGIAAVFSKGFDCIVLENHGVVVGGTTLRQAFERLEALDLSARTILRARTVGVERLLSSEQLAFARPPESGVIATESTSVSDEERVLRESLCAIARRAHSKRLMTSTQGTLSARLATDAFLLTPTSIPLDCLVPGDLLREGLAHSGGDEPDPRVALHAALYRAHPEVHAVAHGVGVNAAGFSAAGVSLPSRTIPESFILVREPVSIPFSATHLDPESVATLLGPDSPAGLVQNDGALTLGVSVLDAFDRLEVLEATAAAVIASRSLGELTVMNDEQISELRDAYFPTGGLRGTAPEESG
jgi:L-fuculose-phosphate aldolase